MAEVEQDELAWDYTADECSPLLRRAVSPYGRRNQPCALTRAQARYLLHTLTEAAQILNAELQHRSPEERVTDAVTTQRRIFNLYLRTVRYFPIVTIVLQILAIVIDTAVDASSGNHEYTKPYTAAVFVSFGATLMILFYVDVLYRFLDHRADLLTLMVSFISSAILFANIYAVFYCFDKSVWNAQATEDSHELYVVIFLRMVHTSISVLTFSHDASGMQVKAWYPLTVLSIQMLLAYGHLLLIIVTVLGSFLPRTHSVVSNSHVECPPLQPEPDTESLSFGTNLANVASNPVNVCVHNSVRSEHQGAMLLSNSI